MKKIINHPAIIILVIIFMAVGLVMWAVGLQLKDPVIRYTGFGTMLSMFFSFLYLTTRS